MNDYFDLGDYRRSISTGDKNAGRWFNQGLIWCYGFNHEEAVRCFQKVIDIDPGCAMGYWGMAYASGPFYNKPWEWYGNDERPLTIKLCHHFASEALRLKSSASAADQALIEALLCKHPSPEASHADDLVRWMQDYAKAMQQALAKFPQDLDVICLSAEALINITPWKLWDYQSGQPAKNAATLQAIAILQQGLDLTGTDLVPTHPGLAHFYIHAQEMSPNPNLALPQADQLRALNPQCGHLLHMASHIDSLCGDWQQALDANSRAIEADLTYLKLRGTDEFYLVSVLHNHEFKIWAAMFLGQFAIALQTADELCALINDDMLKTDKWYLTTTLEGYYSSRVHVLVRFGRWQQICDEALPDDTQLYQITTILLIYAKAIAYATLGDIERGREYQRQFAELLRDIPDWHVMANNRTLNILEVADAMMNGEIEYHAGNHEVGFKNLRRANRLHDQLAYCEPWAWMHPPRHALAALLLEQGQVDEALMHYEDDLGISDRLPRCTQHRNNIWALHGYHECLQRLHRFDEAEQISPGLNQLVANADISINSSCCCRKAES